jgi:hypothetical protein
MAKALWFAIALATVLTSVFAGAGAGAVLSDLSLKQDAKACFFACSSA